LRLLEGDFSIKPINHFVDPGGYWFFPLQILAKYLLDIVFGYSIFFGENHG